MRTKDAIRAKKYRARLREIAKEEPELIPHGTLSGFRNWGCKCSECRAVQNKANTAWRRQRG